MAADRTIVKGGFRSTLALFLSIIALGLSVMNYTSVKDKGDLKDHLEDLKEDLQKKMEDLKEESSKKNRYFAWRNRYVPRKSRQKSQKSQKSQKIRSSIPHSGPRNPHRYFSFQPAPFPSHEKVTFPRAY